MSNFQISIQLFAQIAVILAACRVVGWAARKVGQPQVVGEMIAGILLGPSLFGLLAPDAHATLFPKNVTMTVIYCLAQIGLVLYMFLVGVEFNVNLLRERARSATAVSLAGMIVPFIVGAAIALYYFGDGSLFGEGVDRGEAVLFLGAAMCITAFPILARIIYESGIARTRLGTLALAAGSIDDAAAWCVLAVVLGNAAGDPAIAVWAIAGGVGYSLVALLAIRPLLRPLGKRVDQSGMTASAFSVILILLIVAAWMTDFVGIHAVFGAFILGVAMPRGPLAAALEAKIEPLTTHLLVPLFFVYSGLNTRIDLVNRWDLWVVAAVVLAGACIGKFAACWAAARLCGEDSRTSAALGALMNARGLMELIILNIGLERGLITPELFSVMVIMALVTTLMATPAFRIATGSAQARN